MEKKNLILFISTWFSYNLLVLRIIHHQDIKHHSYFCSNFIIKILNKLISKIYQLIFFCFKIFLFHIFYLILGFLIYFLSFWDIQNFLNIFLLITIIIDKIVHKKS